MRAPGPEFPVIVLLGKALSPAEVAATLEKLVAPRAVRLVTEGDVEEADALLLDTHGKDEPLALFAEALGRPVLRFDAATGEVIGELPLPADRDGWLPALFAAAHLEPDAELETIFAKMDAFANQAAPQTRGWRSGLVVLQGLAVLAPMLWLVRHLLGWPGPATAALSLGAVLLLIGVNWWLRWRGMQKTWARARLVAEVARALLATRGLAIPGVELRGVPGLRHLRRPGTASADWCDTYLRDRIDEQADYFQRKRAAAEKERAGLTRWSTLLLDLALVFALAGLVLFSSDAARRWVRAVGGEWPEVALGLAGVLLPVGLLLIDSLRTLRELNHRTARFAQQQQALEQARRRLAFATNETAALAVVQETERRLLDEVFDWYFQTETAEHFFRFRQSAESAQGLQLAKGPRRFGWTMRAAALLGLAGLFLLRVLFGRVLWIAGSGLVAFALVFNLQPLVHKNELRKEKLGELQDKAGQAWQPTPARAESGCILIVHGLHGNPAGERSWMRRMSAAIESRLGENPPNIGLLDWHSAANPAQHFGMDFGSKLTDFLADVAAIRPQGEEVGEELAWRLLPRIRSGEIHRDRPLYLIGHSAGGFVVTRVALIVHQYEPAVALRLVLLDTPEPNADILLKLPRDLPDAADYYITSRLVHLDVAPTGLRVQFVPGVPPDLGPIAAHSYANEWFLKTIEKPGSGEGFDRSPWGSP